MTTGKQYNDKFKSHLGQGGSQAHKYCHMSGGPWCCAQVSLVYGETDKKLFYGGKYCTYCPNAIKWARAFLAEIPIYIAQNGDPIFFDWNNNGIPDHIGEVDYHIDTETIATVEGNTGNPALVRKKVRPKKYVLGVFRQVFAPTKKIEKKPLVVDGDFGQCSVYMLQVWLGMTPTGILTKDTVKNLQKKVKTTPDGSWQTKTSKAIQRMVGVKQDGAFGEKSVQAFQSFINAKVYPTSKESQPAPVKTTPKPSPKGYAGSFPTLPTKTAKNAVAFAYAYGTKLKVYKYHGGKPKGNYKTALNKYFPDRKKWGAKAKAGASCDVFVGTVSRASGYSKAPRGLKELKKWLPKNLKKTGKIINGDILLRSNHVSVFLELKGGNYVANAHHEKNGGTYGIIEKVCSYTSAFRPNGVSYFSKGDTFTEVKNLQKFLNWFGGYELKEDYIFGKATENAVKDFQDKCGLKITGRFGETELKKAKTIKK